MAHWRTPTKREAGETSPLFGLLCGWLHWKYLSLFPTEWCEECGQYPADLPGTVCVGCEAYREHTGQI